MAQMRRSQQSKGAPGIWDSLCQVQSLSFKEARASSHSPAITRDTYENLEATFNVRKLDQPMSS